MIPEVSIVLCTRNRASRLSDTLATFTRIRTDAAWELIIVDNGSTDETGAVIDRFRSAWHGRLVVLTEPDPGVSRCKNRGWRLAAAEIVLFTDDDCYPDPDLLTHVAQCFREDPRLGFLGGRLLLHDPADARMTIQESEERLDFAPGAFLEPGLIHGANLAFRKRALEAVGGFDERFGPGVRFVSCEDVEVMARVSAAGWPGAYDPRPMLRHHHRRKSVDDLVRGYDQGRGAYYAKCLLNPTLRDTYARHWYWLARRQSWRQTAREVAAAVDFLVRHAVGRLRSAR